MEQFRLQPPEPFNFKTPDDWRWWKRRFEQFRVASGLSGEAVLSSTRVTAEKWKEFDAVVDKFDAFFKVRKNVIFERARFNRRNQLQGESAEQYTVQLNELTENCEYGDLKDEMIRDRQLSQRLQLDADLTLDKAKKMIRQREAVQEQQQVLYKRIWSERTQQPRSAALTSRTPSQKTAWWSKRQPAQWRQVKTKTQL